MNGEKIKDPTADQAVGNVDRKERTQRKLEHLHGVRVGEIYNLTCRIIEGEHGNKKTICKRVVVQELYKHFVRVGMPGGYSECFRWTDFKRRAKPWEERPKKRKNT